MIIIGIYSIRGCINKLFYQDKDFQKEIDIELL